MTSMFLLLLACQGDPAVHSHDEVTPAPSTAAHPADSQPVSGEGSHGDHDEAHAAPAGELALSLNGTEKWAMDEHTRASLAEIRNTLGAAQLTTSFEAATLADTIDAQLNGLITGCTMDGDAHDELHVFLTAFMPAVEALRQSPDEAAARAQVKVLWEQVREADRVFE